MADLFEPHDWYWIIGNGASSAWSSRTRSWVSTWPLDRQSIVFSEVELDAALRRCTGYSPFVRADDVRTEARRRMRALLSARDDDHLDIIISNGSREAIRLLRKGSANWTPEETARAAQLEAIDAAIEAIRAASNALEPLNPIPENFADSRWWPA